MASTRAPAVAEVLWELKRHDKVARYSTIAGRAGFSAGANGRAMETCLKTIRKEWPHLEAWRAIPDDGEVQIESQQAADLKKWGAEFSDGSKPGRACILVDEARVMIWAEEELISKATSSASVE